MKKQFLTEKEEKQVTLPNGEIAKYIIERVGQEDPEISDKVQTRLRFILPKATGGDTLARSLRFGKRIRIMGESLGFNWGRKGDEGMYHYEIFSNDNYKQGFEEANKKAEEEIEKLVNALNERQKALEEADYYEE